MFYDRKEERKKLSESIQEKEKNQAKIILLYGYSGVGKTGLMSELFRTDLSPIPHIQIQNSKIAPSMIENCFYLNRFYEEMLRRSKDTLSPDNLSRQHPLVTLRFRQLCRFLIRWLSSLAHLYEKETFIEDQYKADLLQKRDFIVECLNNTQYIVDFENIQYIDRQSFDFLKDIISQARKTVFVFEYTLDEDSQSSYQKFYAELSRFDAKIECFFLERLNDADALRLATVKPKSELDQDSILESYHRSQGNLYQIILYDRSAPGHEDQIQNRVKELAQHSNQSNELFLLNLVYLNGGKFETQRLRMIVTTPNSNIQLCLPQKEFDRVLGKIISAKMLIQKQNYVCIHDSLLSALEEQPANPVLYSAYGVLTNYYVSQSPSDKSAQIYRLSQLFSLYLRFMDEQLLTILPSIRKAVLSYKYPQDIYNKLEQFITLLKEQPNTNKKMHQAVCELLIELSIELGDSEKSWELFSELRDLDPNRSRLLKARIYELGMGTAEVDAISELVLDAEENSKEKLLLQLSQIHVAMRVWPQSETLALVQQVVQNDAYRLYPEYAFALADYAELVDNSQKAQDLYQEGIALLEENHRNELASCLYANMCMSLGYLGRLQEAKDCLSKIRRDGINEPVYLNNSVVLDLLQEHITEDSVKTLQDALLLRVNRFEEIIIRNNLLIAWILLKNWTCADMEYQYLCKSEFETFRYGEFLQMNYQNFLFYSKEQNRIEDIRFWEKKLTDLAASSNTSAGTKAVIYAMLHKDTSTVFYGNFSYRAEFLCPWGIPPAYADNAFSAK